MPAWQLVIAVIGAVGTPVTAAVLLYLRQVTKRLRANQTAADTIGLLKEHDRELLAEAQAGYERTLAAITEANRQAANNLRLARDDDKERAVKLAERLDRAEERMTELDRYWRGRYAELEEAYRTEVARLHGELQTTEREKGRLELRVALLEKEVEVLRDGRDREGGAK